MPPADLRSGMDQRRGADSGGDQEARVSRPIGI